MEGGPDQNIEYPLYSYLLCDWKKDVGYVLFYVCIVLEAKSNDILSYNKNHDLFCLALKVLFKVTVIDLICFSYQKRISAFNV